MKKTQIILAVDTPNLEDLKNWSDFCHQHQLWIKIGMETFYNFGKDIFHYIHTDVKIFLDLKLHDIPNTVAMSLKCLTQLPIHMINVHALGGSEMLKMVGQIKQQNPHMLFIAVTHLTSLDDQNINELGFKNDLKTSSLNLAQMTYQAKLDGVVCSGHEIAQIKSHTTPNFITVVPGIRLEKSSDDQKRIITPLEAIQLGADFLVIGRPITQASNPVQIIHQIKALL